MFKFVVSVRSGTSNEAVLGTERELLKINTTVNGRHENSTWRTKSTREPPIV